MPVSEETPVVLPLANHDMSDWPTTTEPELRRTRHGNRRWLKAIEWSGQIIPMLPKAILGLLVVVMGSVILWASMKAVFDGRAAVEPISVSEEWGKRGFAGTALSQRLLDEISRINQVAKTSKQRAQFGGAQSSVLANIQVPQTSLNVQAIVTILRDLFGQDETRIGGELTGEPGKDLSLVIRTEHKAARHAEPLTNSDVDKLIKKAAVEILPEASILMFSPRTTTRGSSSRRWTVRSMRSWPSRTIRSAGLGTQSPRPPPCRPASL